MHRGRTLFWPALAVCLYFAFRPLLSQPFALDDIGILHYWAKGGLFRRCLLPHFFRPLVAPVYWAYFELLGPRPWGLRAMMLALHLVTSCLVFRLAARLTRDRSAAALAACLYAFARAHWSTMSLTAGLAQSASDALLWTAVLVCVETPSPRRAISRSLPWATAALLFKEHAVAFAALAPAARWARRGRFEPMPAGAAAAWASAYAALRLAGPSSVLGPDQHFPFGIPRQLASQAAIVLEVCFDFMRHPLAPGGASPRWLVACAGVVLCLAAGVARLKPSPRTDWRRAALFGALGIAAGSAPYLPFAGGVELLAGGRLSLACAAAAAGVAACLAAGARSLVKGRSPVIVAALCALLAARAALSFRAPDPDEEPFRLLGSLNATSEARARVETALAGAPATRVVALQGFDPRLRLPWLLDATDGERRFFSRDDPAAPKPDIIVTYSPGQNGR